MPTLQLYVGIRAFEGLGDLAMIMKENAVANYITETELATMNLVDSIKISLML